MIIVLQIIIGLFLFYLVWTIIRFFVSTIIFFIKIIIDEIVIRKVYSTIDYTVMDFMSKIGRAILFVGKIGSGKTTQQALFTHYATIDCWTETRKVCDDFADEFTEIDFTLLNVEIEKLYDDYRLAMETDPDINYHFKNLFDVLADKYCDLLSDRFTDDGVTRTYFYDAFYKYVFAYCRVKNNHFVVANTQVYSYITNNYALGFTGNMMSLKEMYDNESLYFDEYMVIVKDENSADPDDYYLNYQSIYKDDNGKHLFIRFIRHLFEGTVRFCTTDQDACGMVANQRKIMDTFIYVMGLKIKCERPTLTKFILNLKTTVRDLEQFYARFFKIKRKREHYLNNNNNFKRFIKFLMGIQRNLYSKAMVEYTDRIYHDADDCKNLRNNSDSHTYYEDAKLIGPIQWCFGSIDTHEFHYIYRWFQSKYGKNFWNLKEFKEIVTIEDLNEKTAHMLKRKKSEKKLDNNDMTESDYEV